MKSLENEIFIDYDIFKKWLGWTTYQSNCQSPWGICEKVVHLVDHRVGILLIGDLKKRDTGDTQNRVVVSRRVYSKIDNSTNNMMSL